MIRRVARADLAGASLPIAQALPAPCKPLESAPARAPADAVQAALRTLLQQELALKPEHICAVVERELLRSRRARAITLHVHPLDAALLGSSAAYVARLELRGSLEIVEDEALTRGGCLLSSNLGHVDARLETRLEAALALLASGAFDGD